MTLLPRSRTCDPHHQLHGMRSSTSSFGGDQMASAESLKMGKRETKPLRRVPILME